ncbi:MAG: glutamine-hydrolyzing GMP synthase [Bacteroidetes bacterium]|nr:MAG: glutamine-hydrolyzing GMP synthase [Bacteroidota bacterium]REJ99832.1 MAG: glutamine-hydrolyzing GMP synthase [Bacteroidota bacterium]REK34205.1 MAG: glutamine-hydrolyzing GMP synthase [Bacteroidota bacterium]REK50535.1 MAG: glutamine-hydrolyzing GMP synthase [Bacteroidota bacterium]
MHQRILIIDFGSQYTQLIARRIRELNVYCEIHPFFHIPPYSWEIMGVILSGSPSSVNDREHPEIDLSQYRGKIPVLGICYGAQLMAHKLGSKIAPSKSREYGRANLRFVDNSDSLLKGVSSGSTVWMSHGDSISPQSDYLDIIASTKDVEVAGYKIKQEKTYGIQFHPEVTHSEHGKDLLKNFVVDICNCSQDWTPASFVEETIESLRKITGNDQVVLGLSGGVDSSVAAMLLHRAIGKNLHCIFVDNGLLRKNEFQAVLDSYMHMGLNVTGVDAKKRFYSELKNISDPELKRKAIGKVFIDVFDEEAHRIKNVRWLAQGTIYPDVIESVSVKGPSATIKSHHNVGGLPERMNLNIVEPLRTLFKDEVRRVGKELGLDSLILDRHPFPGPGLAIRILGDITEEKVAKLQEADDIFISHLRSSGLYSKVWQAGAILLPVHTVGVMGDERTYENVVCLRAVTSVDGMTADWAHLPSDFLSVVSNEIINKVKGINRVVFDISSKPPATIEWE